MPGMEVEPTCSQLHLVSGCKKINNFRIINFCYFIFLGNINSVYLLYYREQIFYSKAGFLGMVAMMKRSSFANKKKKNEIFDLLIPA
jgi:hypothetical protein